MEVEIWTKATVAEEGYILRTATIIHEIPQTDHVQKQILQISRLSR